MAAAKGFRSGQKYIWRGRAIEFIARYPRTGKRPAKSIFKCMDFIGLMGLDDRGLVEFLDKELGEIEGAK